MSVARAEALRTPGLRMASGWPEMPPADFVVRGHLASELAERPRITKLAPPMRDARIWLSALSSDRTPLRPCVSAGSCF